MSNEKANNNLIQTNDEGWESLFDGKTLNGWHRYNRKGVKPIWTAKKGVLTFDPNLIQKGDYVHDLVTDKFSKVSTFYRMEYFRRWKQWNFWGVQEGED